jgi:hypothetical protein
LFFNLPIGKQIQSHFFYPILPPFFRAFRLVLKIGFPGNPELSLTYA